ncbi:ABC-F family ATP-binding cassette domain-containing protein [Pseudomonas sp. BP8]|uniref:ABC-F family ATP-binding cassette domain-containing protein n=1 Tax=Pseudomonas sp. BP8 TaxID=2817864 RepID=UPI001AE78913|nr:ABC-F family ATP-binding cassette domain-containing protein [Pseudomonas sp. BP8]MBP2262708.1 ATPase subunit of ABC transporter with duplicated ATPase domains [Pseudomonas sp. BP8]HDS1734269.1 ABC-F family ATP-binding cassette domain-containing protein [Pseudomonas putida]
MTNTSILTLDSVTLVLPNGRPLFTDLNESFDQRRTGLVGRNGVGKSLLGQILAGMREPSSGRCLRHGRVHHLQQQLITPGIRVADLAQVGGVLAALQRIEAGSVDPADFETVGERWDIREQLHAQFARCGLAAIDLQREAACLSGGQAMRVALAGALISQADYLVLDEPSNHLDHQARRQLLAMLEGWHKGLLVISHDRALLEQMQRIVELSPQGLRSYGGNHAFYAAHKAEQQRCAQQEVARLKHQRQLQARDLQRQRESLERHQARAGRHAKQANQAKVLLDRQQQRSEATAGKQRHDQRVAQAHLSEQLRLAARQVGRDQPIILQVPTAHRHPGREVLAVHDLQLPRGQSGPLNLRLCSGERVAVTGANGSGKSTLLQVLHGTLQPASGSVRLTGESVLLDQHCSVLAADHSTLDHLRRANPGLDQAELRTRLAQLGLDASRIDLPSALLSGGERLKAALAAVLYGERAVDLLLLDEPSNHLDLPSLEALEFMLGAFRGGLVVVSHDLVFLHRLQLNGYLQLG